MSEELEPVGNILDNIAKSEGFEMYPDSNNSTSMRNESSISDYSIEPKLDNADEYIKVYDGEKEIELPKSAKVRLSTRAGDEMELSVKDWADAPWSKRETSRIVNEKAQLEKQHQAMANYYREINSLFSPEASDFRGAEWTAQALKALYNMNPERGEDIAAFVDAIRTNGISEDQIKQSELQKKNIELEKANKYREAQVSQNHLQDYSLDLSYKLVDALGVEPQLLDDKIKNLIQSGQINSVTDKNSAEMAATTIFNHFIVDKALGAFEELKLTPEEVDKCKEDTLGLLRTNPRMSVPELANKLGALMGKTPNRVAQTARDKVERFKETSGRRPEQITPKPLRRDERIDTRSMGPFSYLERTTGLKFN